MKMSETALERRVSHCFGEEEEEEEKTRADPMTQYYSRKTWPAEHGD